jgi:hypothetical protein
MRVAFGLTFAFIVLSAAASGQTTQIDASSLRAGMTAMVVAASAAPNYDANRVASMSLGVFSYSADPSVATKSLEWQQIAKMDASVGSHRNVKRGAEIGLVMGVIGGVAYGRSANPGSMGRGYNEAVGGIGFGAIGAVGGALLGLAWRSDN